MPEIYYQNIDKEFVQTLLEASKKYAGDRKHLADSRIELFAAALYRQLVVLGESFQLIVSPGNSGLYMLELTKCIYDMLDIEKPNMVAVPLFRNSSFDPDSYRNYFNDVDMDNVTKVLFVDDEIMKGTYVKYISDILDCLSSTQRAMTIVAENQFFEWHHDVSCKIKYYAYARLLTGFKYNISYFLDDALAAQIMTATNAKNYNEAFAIALTGRLKDEVTNSFVDKLVSDGEISINRDAINRELKELVRSGIKKFQEGEIQFPF